MNMDIQLKNALKSKRMVLILDLQQKRDKIYQLNEEVSEIEKDIVYINSLIRDPKIEQSHGQSSKKTAKR